jgi:transcriptional regulator with GAF, ATPase, and Fis domain
VQPNQSKPPFLLLLRPTEWVDFSGSDRVFLQAICQLWVRAQTRAVEVHDLRRENAQLKQKVRRPLVIGGSPAMENLRERARKAAATNATVLLLGETGSGKEVIAQFIHESSSRREGPFVKVNCGAIPETLIESELFGHVKGAFTDARQDRKGKFAQADGGTIFLDEIGEMPIFVQPKLLRAIENGEVEPLGSEKVISVNVRILAATHRDLKQMVREKQFREDLFYRLNVVVISVPPLRDHLDDVEAFATHFLERFCAENGLAEMSFAPESIAELQKQPWPGNVRELRNVVQRCAASSETPFITLEVVRQATQSTI